MRGGCTFNTEDVLRDVGWDRVRSAWQRAAAPSMNHKIAVEDVKGRSGAAHREPPDDFCRFREHIAAARFWTRANGRLGRDSPTVNVAGGRAVMELGSGSAARNGSRGRTVLTLRTHSEKPACQRAIERLPETVTRPPDGRKRTATSEPSHTLYGPSSKLRQALVTCMSQLTRLSCIRTAGVERSRTFD